VVYGFYVEPRWIQSPEVEVRLSELPAGFEGARIALISDLHVGPHFGLADVRRVGDAVNALQPDAVVLLGDFVARDPADAAVVSEGLAHLTPPLGVYAVLGNHDQWVDTNQVSFLLSRGNVRVLRNNGLPLERRGDRLWLAGIEDIRTGRPNPRAALAGARPGDRKILLAHNPMAVRGAAPLGVDLVLAGHTHGGQVQLPLIGPLVLPIRDRSLAQGLVSTAGTQIYVTRGVGVGTPPVRLGSRPEIPVVVLRRAR
jgi:predicted MPP superfamily phosphohydrolase